MPEYKNKEFMYNDSFVFSTKSSISFVKRYAKTYEMFLGNTINFTNLKINWSGYYKIDDILEWSKNNDYDANFILLNLSFFAEYFDIINHPASRWFVSMMIEDYDFIIPEDV